MGLGHFSHRTYTHFTTPVEPLTRLTKALGGPTLWVKRDDRTGLAGGGNKTRKLEYLVSEAIDGGATALITCGSVQSNHCRLTAAAANREGLACHLVIREKRPDQYREDASGNNLLYRLLGATIHVVPPNTDLDTAMSKLAYELAASGTLAHVIPMGGSNATGCLGYVRCAKEIAQWSVDAGVPLKAVVCASSSGGTHAGLVAGLHPEGVDVVGISVDWDSEPQTEVVVALVDAVTQKLFAPSIDDEAVVVHDGYVGPGYAQGTPEMAEAVRMFAQLEGILLDPVYTGKTAAGFIDLIRRGTWSKDDHVMFVHTGGAPALFEYAEQVLG